MNSSKVDNFTHIQPLVSVVIPTFNRAHLILRALESVKRQSYRPLDVIVADDGSTDDTERVVTDWIDQHAGDGFAISYWKQPNQGGNVARNFGIDRARGEYVAFLDSDDGWHPEKLAKQVGVMRGDASIGAVYCGLQSVVIETGEVKPTSPRPYPQGNLLNQLLVKDVTAPTSTYVVRKSVFERVGQFDTDLQARQDWDMWIRVASEYNIAAVPEVLVDFGEHTGPRTISNPDKEIRAYARILEKYAALRAKSPLSIRRASKAAYYRRLGRVHFHQKNSYARAMAYQLRAIAAWPFEFDSYAALVGMLLPRSNRERLHHAWNRCFGWGGLRIGSH